MPELPEVETVRRGLASRVAGRTVDSVWVGRERVVRRTSREELIAGLTGVKIEGADRRGKYLLLPLDSGEQVMIHLRMSGQVLLVDGDVVIDGILDVSADATTPGPGGDDPACGDGDPDTFCSDTDGPPGTAPAYCELYPTDPACRPE